MRKFFGVLCMLLGLAMLAGSGWLVYENYSEDQDAGTLSASALMEMKGNIAAGPRDTVTPQPTPAPTPTSVSELDPAASASPELVSTPYPTPELQFVPTPIPEMPTMQIDGHDYIGYIEIPTIGINLPVMSDWDYSKLRISPCRYRGSVYDDTMIILAHNYERHFGHLYRLNIGDPVQFVDVQGNIFKYVVAAIETLERDDVERMIDNEYDLTLFTCTYGGVTRVTVRLKRVLTY